MIRVKSKLNTEFLDQVRWDLKIPNWNYLNTLVGLSPGYIYQLRSGRWSLTSETLDRLTATLLNRYHEMGLAAPDDLWYKLVTVEYSMEDDPRPDLT